MRSFCEPKTSQKKKEKNLAFMEEVVVENLFNGEREAKIKAARELVRLSTKQRHNLAERGVISPLFSMLHSQHYKTVEAALSALLSLTFCSERLVYSYSLLQF